MAASIVRGVEKLNASARHKCIARSIIRRRFSTSTNLNKALVLGVYENDSTDSIDFTGTAGKFNEKLDGKIAQLLLRVKKPLKGGKTRTLHGVDSEFSSVIVTCIGKKGEGYDELETVDKGRESVRAAVAKAVLELRELGENEIEVDPCGDIEASAEGCHLALFSYDELKAEKSRKPTVSVSAASRFSQDKGNIEKGWKRGTILADGQNLSRRLMEMPSNLLTPTKFAEIVKEQLSSKCDVIVRDKAWAESMKMGSFLSVSRGSVEPPVFLEIEYKGKQSDSPIALVGKGVTFDTGGISIKPSQGMDAMRGDMGGAACVAGTLHSISRLELPVYIKAFIPLCENMPSGSATKPGDVVTAMNGKTIQVDNTDAEGRLILADALCYSEQFNPSLILDMATLTGAIDVALGAGAAGVFTNSATMWDKLQKASIKTGDRVWRMPLFNHYTKKITKCQLADLNNIGGSRSAGACTAAAFLKEFVTNKNWLHIDIAGIMSNEGDVSYLGKGMSGRPTRTITEFINIISKESQ
ncbi:cytosol aminopeptidase-like [Saccostrea echinata]|uniref:cytosol aminopeptidase-like n=1 Tax=Saccostrea echinata TaxID=191078 RepID=UPI002A83806D|nr:cytosol aminopeptidase-like [Saccostrea echinata]